ncbi:hypothetical protein [Nocardia africana]
MGVGDSGEHGAALEGTDGRSGQAGLLRVRMSASVADRCLTRLFTTLPAEATGPEHPAHRYFLYRY